MVADIFILFYTRPRDLTGEKKEHAERDLVTRFGGIEKLSR